MHELDLLRQACEYASRNSDDPRTKVGAVLVTPHARVFGANTFPQGVYRDPERLKPATKYRFVEHAERAAIFKAASQGVSTAGARLFCPWFACTDCARAVIAAGISEVVGLAVLRNETPERWEADIRLAERMLSEAGVSTRLIADKINARVRFDDRYIYV